MGLSTKQQNEIMCLDYFSLPITYKGDDKCNPEQEYFNITQDGKKKRFKNARLEQLLDAKKWRLRAVDMYEQGILDGSTSYSVILCKEQETRWIGKFIKKWRFKKVEKLPDYVIEFLARTMFKGLDKDLCLKYQPT